MERALYSLWAAVLVHWVPDGGAAESWGWCRRHAVASSRTRARRNGPEQTPGRENLPGRSRGQTRTGSPPIEPVCREHRALDHNTPLWHPTRSDSASEGGREVRKVKGRDKGMTWRGSKRHQVEEQQGGSGEIQSALRARGCTSMAWVGVTGNRGTQNQYWQIHHIQLQRGTWKHQDYCQISDKISTFLSLNSRGIF